jgi:hypothetical protein
MNEIVRPQNSTQMASARPYFRSYATMYQIPGFNSNRSRPIIPRDTISAINHIALNPAIHQFYGG